MQRKAMKYLDCVKPILAYLIVLAIVGIVLTSCSKDESFERVSVSEAFIDQLISELPTVEACCPATLTVIDDWIMQNEPI